MVRLLPIILTAATLVSLGGVAANAADLDYGYGRPRVYERPVVVERPVVLERPVVVEERPVFAPRPYGYGYRHWHGRPFYGRGPFFPYRHFAYGPHPYRFGY